MGPFSILSWGCGGGGRLNREGLGVISKPDRQMGEGLIREGALNKGLGVGGWGGGGLIELCGISSLFLNKK